MQNEEGRIKKPRFSGWTEHRLPFLHSSFCLHHFLIRVSNRVSVYDFDHARRLGCFRDLNGDLPPQSRRDCEDMRAKLRQIKRHRERHRLAVAYRRLSERLLRDPQDIHFSGHAIFAASRVPWFRLRAFLMAHSIGDKKAGWPKTFLLNAARFPYTFLQMNNPDLIWKIDSCNLHFQMSRFKRPS
jgi:hypothetical protein